MLAPTALAQEPGELLPVTTPRQALGFDIGDDYQLAGYSQMIAYWQRLETESDRIRLVDIGQTSEGRTHWMAIVSAPENLERLDEYRRISSRLARAVDEEDVARRFAREGKAVVWIDGGLHANETAGSMQLIEMVYQMVSGADEETLRLLDDVIQIYVPANPDGIEMVADWYMRRENPEQRSLEGLPKLYQKYAGHDNNRDFFIANLPETRNLNQVLYQQWFPQIVYDHHQSGPAGAVVFVPPFRDPVNYNLDPLVSAGVDAVGTAIQTRLLAEGKPGAVSGDRASYSMWWNGGLRTTAYFHNMIGILTEIVGDPTPMEIPLIAGQQLPTTDSRLPVAPQTWHFRQTIDYEIAQNRAVLDYASRHREELLMNIYRMGRNAIEKGSRDNWTVTPSRIDALRQADAQRQGALNPASYADVLNDPAARDARAYVVSRRNRDGSQVDHRVIDALTRALDSSGINYYYSGESMEIEERNYPQGSIVVRTNQPFRPFIRDLFEPQDHPDDFAYPGGPPVAPYDMAGWTLALQMGMDYGRIYELDNDAPLIVLAEVGTLLEGPREYTASIAVYDQYGGLTSSGWTQWVLDQYAIPYEVVYANDLDAGDLQDRFDAIIVPDLAFRLGRSAPEQPRAADIPAEYRGMLGEITQSRTLPALRDFVEAGGHLITSGTSTALAAMLGVPVTDHLIEEGPGGSVERVPRERFYVPGSLVRAELDTGHRLTEGMREKAVFFFDASPVFTASTEAISSGEIEVVATYPENALASGWAWGEQYLTGGIAVAEAPLGEGKIVLFGPDVTFRGQSWGTFPLLLNALADAAPTAEDSE